MSNESDVIDTPRDYYFTRRVNGHNDWSFAFWRELFQNAVDAGAKNINITVADADGRGPLWKADAVEKVVRVTFSDDGSGITSDVLNNVFFKPGRSTKSGGSNTGGFGTARLMLCFSQPYYRIRTLDNLVEGTASRYKIRTVAEASAAMLSAITEAQAFAGAALQEQLRADAAAASLGGSDGITTLARVNRAIEAMRGATTDNVGSEELAEAMTEAVAAAEKANKAYRLPPEYVRVGKAMEEMRQILVDGDRKAGGHAEGVIYEAIRSAVAYADVLRYEVRAEQIRADLAEIQANPGKLKGSRFEIDIDPYESEYSGHNANKQKLLSKLDDYLSMSQVPCKVTVNGEEVKAKALKGPARRTLVAKQEDSEEVVFGTIHVSQGERAKHKGKVVVRLNGSTMFTSSTSSSHQVIVELEPKIAKRALTDNRDGLKEPFTGAMAGFIEELVVDSKSALEESNKRKHIEIKGGKGTIRLAPPIKKVDFRPRKQLREAGMAVPGALPDAEAAALPRPRYTTADEYVRQGFGGVTAKVMDQFLETVAKGEATFLADHGDSWEARDFAASVKDLGGREALKTVPESLARFVVGELAARVEATDKAITAEQAAENAKLADMHDVHIVTEDIGDDPKLQNAVRRYSPGFWKREGAEGKHVKGRGMQAHMLLAAWTVCCKYAVKALFIAHPHLAEKGPIQIGTGFMFAKSEEKWVGDRYVKRRTGAQHRLVNDVHLLLLNPVLDNGSTAWDLTKERRESLLKDDGTPAEHGVADMRTLACHEVEHILRDAHDEEYASGLTEVASLFDQVGANAEMREVAVVLRAMYGSGKTLVQAMDAEANLSFEEEEAKPKRRATKPPRPAEVLLAHAAPTSTMMVGLVSAPENANYEAPVLRQALDEAMDTDSDGVVTIDCDMVQALEVAVSETMRHPTTIVEAVAEAVASPQPDLSLLAGMSFDDVSEVVVHPVQVVEASGSGIVEKIAALPIPEPETVEQPHSTMSGLAMFANFTGDLSLKPRITVVNEEPDSVAAPAPDLKFLASLDMGLGVSSPVARTPTPDLERLAVMDFGSIPPSGESKQPETLDPFGAALAAAAAHEAKPPAPGNVEPDISKFPLVVEDPGLSERADLVGEEFDFDDNDLGARTP